MRTRQALPIAAPAALLCALTALSCAGDGTGPGALGGPALAVNVAALNLQGVGDVVWDVEVRNGAGTPAVVWQRRLSSSRYGDGAGSASYVGTCDAGANPNTVRVWVVGVYSAPVTTLGSFAAGGAGDVNGVDVPFQNPTATAPLERTVSCAENTDVEVQFDVALMRPAQQGFFDIAVAFNNIFCSAKFDCCTEDASGTACAADLRLLFDAAGARNTTMVLGLACTAGPRTDVETELYLDPLTLDCTSPSAASFAADITLSPAGPAGNQCTAGAMTGCPAVTEHHGLDADTWLYQLAVYRGTEALTSGGVDAQKVYWNVALGVKRPAIASCWLETRATADDALGTGVVDHGTIAAGAVYPYLVWEVNLATCLAEPLTFGDPAAMVRTEYTRTTDASTGFAYGFGPSPTAGPFCPAPCDNGGACLFGACACAAGYSGLTCSSPVCAAGCDNGGTCTAPSVCTCVGGFSGDHCQTPPVQLDVANGTAAAYTNLEVQVAGAPFAALEAGCPTGYSLASAGAPAPFCFIQSNGECGTAETSLGLWVRLPSLAANGHATLTATCAAATAASPGPGVFRWYDDLNGTALDLTTTWSNQSHSGTLNHAVANGYARLSFSTNGCCGHISARHTVETAARTVFENRQRANGASSNWTDVLRMYHIPSGSETIVYNASASLGLSWCDRCGNPSGPCSGSGTSFSTATGTWYTYSMVKYADTGLRSFRDGVQIWDRNYPCAGTTGFGTGISTRTSDYTIDLDWARIRNYASAPPTVTVVP